MCLKNVTKRLKGTSTKSQKWYKIVTKNSAYEGKHFQVYRTVVKNTPVIIGDRYVHTPKKNAGIIFGMSKTNPEYDKARQEYNKLYSAWEKKYRSTNLKDKKSVWLEKPQWTQPIDKTGKRIPMYLPRDTYPTGFHFYDLEAARKGVSCSPRRRQTSGRLSSWVPEYQILECNVKRIHTYGEDAYGKACVAYEYEPVKIIN